MQTKYRSFTQAKLAIAFLFFSALFLVSQCFAADVLISLSDARLNAGPYYTNRTIRIYPMSTPTVNVPLVVLSNPLQYTNDASGNLYVSNMVAGLYRVTVLAPPIQDTFMFLLTTNDVGLVNIANNLVAAATATFPAGSVAWAAAVSDSRYGSASSSVKYLVQGTNIVLNTNGTSITVNGSTDTNVVNTLIANANNANAGTATNAINSTNFWGKLNWTNFPTWFFASNAAPLNVKRDFGAIGDGVADDTAAIQAGLNVVGGVNTNGTLYFPAGTYKITSPLIVPPCTWPLSPIISSNPGLVLVGDGMGRTVINAAGVASGGALMLTNANSTGYEGVSIRSMKFQGPEVANNLVGIGIGANAGLTSYAGSLISIRDCAVIGFGYGIGFTNCWVVNVSGCNISSNTFFGICLNNTHASTIEKNWMIGCYNNTQTASGTAVGYVGTGIGLGDEGIMMGNDIANWTNAVVDDELNLTIVDNHFENCNLYFLNRTNTGYASLNWMGGYILEGSTNTFAWLRSNSPALMQFPKGFARKVAIINPIVDNFVNYRPWFNLISDNTSTVTSPNLIFQNPVPALVDGSNQFYVTPINIATVPNPTLLVPLSTINYSGWNTANNFTGLAGMRFTPTTDMTLGSLARFSFQGLTNSHVVMILNADLTTNGLVTLPPSSAIGDWVWAPCSIVVKAGSTNYMVTDVASGGDQFGTYTAPPSWDTNITKIFSVSGTASALGDVVTNTTYGPLNYTRLSGSGNINANGLHTGTFSGNGSAITGLTNNLDTIVDVNNKTNVLGQQIKSYSMSLNAKVDFGAVGDGVADDTAALQAGINAVAALSNNTNGTLYIPFGVYKITTPLTIPPNNWQVAGIVSTNSGLRILGAGTYRTVINASGLTTGAIMATNSNAGGYDHLSIEKLTLLGPNSSGTSVGFGVGYGAGVGSFAAQFVSVRDCNVVGFGYGVSMTNCWRVDVVDSFFVSNTLYGICFNNTHSSSVVRDQLQGGYSAANSQVGGTAVGYIGSGNGLGDEGIIEGCIIGAWTNGIVNNEINLNVVDNHLESCSKYFLCTTNQGYAQLSWIGGYILDPTPNSLQWVTAPALMEFPRGFSYKATIINPILDQNASARPYFNLIADGNPVVWPITILPAAYTGLADGVKYRINPLNHPQTVQQQFLAPYWRGGYDAWLTDSNYAGWMGVRFTVGASDMYLDHIGRYMVKGAANSHQILLLNSDFTTNALVNIPPNFVSDDWAWGECYAKLASGTTNYILFDAAGNDYWKQYNAPLAWDTNISQIFAVIGSSPSAVSVVVTNAMYGPLNYSKTYAGGTFAMSGNFTGTFTGGGSGLTNIPTGSLQQNGATLNQVLGWNGSTWVPQTVSSGTGASNFGQLNSGVNTSAIMIVSNGASLYYTNTGTIIASSSAQATHSTNSDFVTGTLTNSISGNAATSTLSSYVSGTLTNNTTGNATTATTSSFVNGTLTNNTTGNATTATTSSFVNGTLTNNISGVAAQATHSTNSDFATTATSAVSATSATAAAQATNVVSGGHLGNMFIQTNTTSTQIEANQGYPALIWDSGENVGIGTFDVIGDISFQGNMTNTFFTVPGVLTNDANGRIRSVAILPIGMVPTNTTIIQGTNGISVVTNYANGVSSYTVSFTGTNSGGGGGPVSISQVTSGTSLGQAYVLGSGTTLNVSGSGQNVATAVIGQTITNNAASATYATNIPSGGKIGTATVTVPPGNTVTAIATTNAAIQLNDASGGMIQLLDPTTSVGITNTGTITTDNMIVNNTMTIGTLNVTDFWPTNTHGLFGDTNLALSGTAGQVLGWVAAGNHLAWVDQTGGAGVGLPGTNTIIAYGDQYQTNAISENGAYTSITNNIHKTFIRPSTFEQTNVSTGMYITFSVTNGNFAITNKAAANQGIVITSTNIVSQSGSAGAYATFDANGTTQLMQLTNGGAWFANPIIGTFNGNDSAATNMVTSQVANYNVLTTDRFVLLSGNHSATLPTAVGVGGKIYTIICSTAGTNAINTTSAQTINGQTTWTNTAQYKATTVFSDGANWWVMSQN